MFTMLFFDASRSTLNVIRLPSTGLQNAYFFYQIKHTSENCFPSQVLIKQFDDKSVFFLGPSGSTDSSVTSFYVSLTIILGLVPCYFCIETLCWISFTHEYFTCSCTRFSCSLFVLEIQDFWPMCVLYKVSIKHRYVSGWPSRIDEILHCDLISCQSTAHNAARRIIFSTSQQM